MNPVTKPTVGILATLLLTLSEMGAAQSSGESILEQSTAILDTAVLFSIGAQEADQALRGSFGWPTFQEGFVDGVYYRFDPDGYARFSSSPRLDEDVFEVVCVEASTACIAKKGELEVGLTSAGQVQIRLSGITPNDSFFVSDRKSELPLPPSILEPLAPRLESLLAGGGELIIKREIEVVQSVSLSGFSAVTTYLRWVAQNQSPRVFPRGWPVPAQSQNQVSSGLTQPNQWTPPNPGPQAAETTWHTQQKRNAASYLATPPNTSLLNNRVSTLPTESQRNQQAGVQVGNLQQQILQLQYHLQQIQAGPGSNGTPFQSAALPQETRYTSGDLQESGQSFAQQAQGRSLPASAGGLGVRGDATSVALDFRTSTLPSNLGPASNTNLDQYQQIASSSALSDQLLLSKRIATLENSILGLRREFSLQILELRENLFHQSRNQVVKTNVLSGQLGVHSVRSQAPIPQQFKTSSSSTALEELEKTLLARLSKQNQGVIVDQSKEPVNPDNVSVNRQIIEDILNELNGPTTLTNPVAEDVTPIPTARNPNGDDFVTLNEYINKVLQSKSQRDPNR